MKLIYNAKGLVHLFLFLKLGEKGLNGRKLGNSFTLVATQM